MADVPPTVTANPTVGSSTTTLTALDINGSVFTIDSGSGGTTVVANPGGATSATHDLTTISVDGIVSVSYTHLTLPTKA